MLNHYFRLTMEILKLENNLTRYFVALEMKNDDPNFYS